MKKVQIRLKNPCSQPWDELPKQNGGLYCAQCDKVVKDFSHMSDEELIAVLTQKRSEPICGRFNPEQLNKTYHYKPDSGNNNMSFWKILMAGLLTFKLPLHSQTTSVKNKIEKVQNKANKTKESASTSSQIITGKVSQRFTKQGLPVKILIYSNYLDTENALEIYSDSSGHYEIELELLNFMKFFKITYSGDGYVERSIVIDKDKLPHQLNVTLLSVNSNQSAEQKHAFTLAEKIREIAKYRKAIEMEVVHQGGIPDMINVGTGMGIRDTIRRKFEEARKPKKRD